MVRHGRVLADVRAGFCADLDPASPGFPATLGDLSHTLKAWRAQLQVQAARHMFGTC